MTTCPPSCPCSQNTQTARPVLSIRIQDPLLKLPSPYFLLSQHSNPLSQALFLHTMSACTHLNIDKRLKTVKLNYKVNKEEATIAANSPSGQLLNQRLPKKCVKQVKHTSRNFRMADLALLCLVKAWDHFVQFS